MAEIKYEIVKKIGVLSKHLYGLTESEFAHILSTFPLVGEDVKSAAMGEFRKRL